MKRTVLNDDKKTTIFGIFIETLTLISYPFFCSIVDDVSEVSFGAKYHYHFEKVRIARSQFYRSILQIHSSEGIMQ